MRRNILKALMVSLFISVLLSTTACTRYGARCQYLTSSSQYCLQPSAVMPTYDVQQKIEIFFKDQHETMITELVVNDAGMQLVGLTPFGHKIVHVSYNNVKANILLSPSKKLDPVLILALIQLATWPADAVRLGTNDALMLEESRGYRRYMVDDQLVLSVHYLNLEAPHQKIHIAMPAVGLTLEMENLPDIKSME